MSSDISQQTSSADLTLFNLCVEARTNPEETEKRSKSKVIVIAGPTACGKSDFALMLAKAVGGEIISGDAMQIYRGLDIGTAKPSKEEQLVVPHHLVDVCDVHQPFTAFDFHRDASHIAQAIIDRKGIPIVVGGSGFYLHTLIYGPPAGPPPSPEVRAILEAEMALLGPQVMYQRLFELDPIYAEGITHNDKHKIVRALEIIAITGKRVSSIPWRGRSVQTKFDFRCWFLHRPKDILYRRIEKRCHKMIEMGLLEEVEKMDQLGLRQNTAASQAIGYRQTLEYLDSPRTAQDYQHFVESFLQASRHYAKRQFTWFRKEAMYRWLDVDVLDFENVMELVMKDYELL